MILKPCNLSVSQRMRSCIFQACAFKDQRNAPAVIRDGAWRCGKERIGVDCRFLNESDWRTLDCDWNGSSAATHDSEVGCGVVFVD